MALKIKNKKINFNLKASLRTLRHSITFPFLLFFYIFSRFVIHTLIFKFFPNKITQKIYPPLARIYHKIISFLDFHQEGNIEELNLVELSLSNMKAKKTRTFITIGGMSVGVGIIVFLVSVGYGLQNLVVTRVARLEEMRQTDVSPQTGTHLNINDKTLSDFSQIKNVKSVLPVIAVVGRISYQKSISDVAVYGVTKDYLESSAIKPVKGKIFESNNLITSLPPETEEPGQVAGVSTTADQIGEFADIIQEVSFSINPESWVKIRQSPSVNSPVLGYAKRSEGTSFGYQVWGSPYVSEQSYGQNGVDENGNPLGQWIKSTFSLWEKKTCDLETNKDCLAGQYLPKRNPNGTYIQEEGYTSHINISLGQALIDNSNPQVLGLTDDNSSQDDSSNEQNEDSTLSTGSLSLIELSEVSSQSAEINPSQITKKVDLPASAQREVVVNRAVLQLLGIDENDAVGKTFETSFVIVGDLLGQDEEKIESNPTEYVIVGVTPEEKTPLLYVPFIDIRSLGLSNFSQAKVIAEDQESLPEVRQQIEAMGFFTHSVSDTVDQINTLFNTIRMLLILLGMVALFVAALGMFNTLTVSLIERTREVGLMKAMGVKSSEVERLFLTESIIMGVFGGFFGILLGFIFGKLLGLILSLFAVIKGVGFIDVSYIPFSLVLFISLLSLIVGVITGVYPAKRAKKISALNALRYE